jgi:hypothetical protein
MMLNTFSVFVSTLDTALTAFRRQNIRVDEVQVNDLDGTHAVIVYEDDGGMYPVIDLMDEQPFTDGDTREMPLWLRPDYAAPGGDVVTLEDDDNGEETQELEAA